MTLAVPAEGPGRDRVPPPIAEGEILLPGYRVVGHLSRACALDVYDVWNEERGCRCVAKVLRPDRAGDLGDRSRLLGEGRLLERLTHPHIVRAYEVIERPRPAVILVVHPAISLSLVGVLRGGWKSLPTWSARMEVEDGCGAADRAVGGGARGAGAGCARGQF